MKKTVYFLGLLLLSIFISCEKDKNPSGNNNANDIRLEIYAVKYGYDGMDKTPDRIIFPGMWEVEYKLYKTMFIPDEGVLKMDLPDTVSDSFFMYAKQNGCYTNIYYFLNGDSVYVDLDSVNPGKVSGVIFTESECSIPYYISNTDLPVYSEGDTAFTLHLDSMGRFELDLLTGEFEIEYPYQQFTKLYTTPFYHDYSIAVGGEYCAFVEKPNIYIYPETKMTLDIKLFFPAGGSVVKSYPQYNKGWNNIAVSPDGRINGEHGYLFYESSNPDFFQYKAGWVIAKGNLNKFFSENMKEYGFIDQEINDFIAYWIPLLIDQNYYAIYPQYNEILDKMVQLRVSESPETIIRLIYCVKGMNNNNLILESPDIPIVERNGFTITEWGVVRK